MKRKVDMHHFDIELLEVRKLFSAVKIMPLASLTQAFPGHASYRFFLWNQLKQAGYNDVDFIGSQTGVNGGAPLYSNFDQDHEGHSGYRADEIAANAIAWAGANKPDIVLLHIGTNDILQNQTNDSTIADIADIIDNLRSVVPSVAILVAHIIPGVTNPTMYPLFNTMIGTLASEKTTAQSPVIAVDQYTGFNVDTDLYDGIHPNDSGERKVAGKWFAALQNILLPPNPPQVTYLSDLNWSSESNGWGPPEKDRSNGETGAADGRTLALNGIGYLKGIGTHGLSDITYNIAGAGYSTFTSAIGVDDEVGSNGSVVFQVYVDGGLKYTSPQMTGVSTTISIPPIAVSGASSLRLVVSNANDGAAYDHADWADALLSNGSVVTPPVVYLSDLNYTVVSNGWGPVEEDKSNAEAASGDGRAITLNGQTFNKGLGVHAASEVDFNLNGQYTQFLSSIGVDDEVGNNGTVNFQIYLDNASTPVFDSGKMTGASATQNVMVDLSGKTLLRLVVTNGGDNNAYDHADWANARLITGAAMPPPPTTYISDVNFTVKANGWGPVERDRSNGESATGDGHDITLNGATYAKGLGVHAASDIVIPLNGKYTQFLSDVGLDDEVGARGSAVFQVFVDGIKVLDSGKLLNSSPTQSFRWDLTGAQQLELIVTNAADNSDFDHADWANARLLA